MKPIEAALDPSDGKINTFKRDTIKGWWEIEVGIPSKWVFEENNNIGTEIIFENKLGKLIRVYPKNHDIVIDDLVTYIDVVIKTNEKIAEKEKQFTDKMEQMRTMLEIEAEKFYVELDELRDNSFKKNNAEFNETLNVDDSKVDDSKVDDKSKPDFEKPKKRGRPPKDKKTEKD